MPDLSKRSEAVEIMDDLNCSGEVVHQTLRELEFINKWLGGNTVTLNGLQKLLTKPSAHAVHVADLGCGSGDMLLLIHRALTKRSIKASLVGIDANPSIIEYAKKNVTHPAISFRALNVFSNEFKKEAFDLVFATLFFHHFTRAQLIDLFTLLKKNTRCGIIVNDLHRHSFAYYSIKLLTRLFSKSSMVKYDAPLSVQRGFKRAELEDILKAAGINSYSLRWKWAFRWQLIIRTPAGLA